MIPRLARSKRIRSVCCQVVLLALGITYISLQIWQVKFQKEAVRSTPPAKINITSLDNRVFAPSRHSKAKSELQTPTNVTHSSSAILPLPENIHNGEPIIPANSILTTIPSWLQEYQAWHSQQRAMINANNWRNFSYVVMQCLDTDLHCGGTADRLKPIPLGLLVAYRHQRLLLVHWTTPKPLEEFLVPPEGGLDWRLPDFMSLQEPSSSSSSASSDKIVSMSSHLDLIQQQASNDTIWHFRYQTHDAGEEYYNEHRPKDSPTFAQGYHAMWRFLFTPTRAIKERIEQHLQELDLRPGHYSAVHIRAAYNAGDHIGKNRLRSRIQSAINCASQLGEAGTPIFVASDSNFAMEVAWAYARKRQEQQRYYRRIVTRIPPKSQDDQNQTLATFSPLHLEKASNPEQRKASDYYDIFVDLYLMGMSQCVVYTKGGFGYWARLISYNSSCGFRYQSAKTQQCRWVSAGASTTSSGPTNQVQANHFPSRLLK